MTYHSSWTDNVFSWGGLENLLMPGILVSALMVPFMAWRYKAETPFITGGFTLALCPFLFAAVLALMHLHSFLEYEDMSDARYITERLRFPDHVLVFGGLASMAAMTAYCVIRVARKKWGRNSVEAGTISSVGSEG
jgi:hypothetical protein